MELKLPDNPEVTHSGLSALAINEIEEPDTGT